MSRALMRSLPALALLLALLTGGGLARASDSRCDSPRAAAATLLDWQQPGHFDLAIAARCLARDGLTEARAQQLAAQLKSVLDARALYVPVEDLPDELDYVDPESGEARLAPLPDLPIFSLVRAGDEWRVSQETLNAVPRLSEETFSWLVRAFQDTLPPVFHKRVGGITGWQALYFSLLVLGAIVAGRLAQRFLSDEVLRRAARLNIQMDRKLLAGTRKPVVWAVMALVFRWGLPDLQLGVRATITLKFFAELALSLSLMVLALRVVDVLADFLRQRAESTATRMDDQIIPLARRATQLIVVVLGVLFVLDNLGTDVGSLIAGLGIGGVAVALAAKDTLENVFGSLTIFTDRPFQIGDWVVLDAGVEGTVEEVGFRSTRIRTFSSSLVTVPNGKVAAARIENMGLRKYRRVKLKLGLTYDTPVEKVEAYVTALRASLKANPAVWDGTQEVHLNDFSASSIDVLVYFFLDVPDWTAELRARAACLADFLRLAEQVGVRFAFPTQTVHLESMPAGDPDPGRG